MDWIGIDERAFIFDEGWLIAMDGIGMLESNHAAAVLGSWMAAAATKITTTQGHLDSICDAYLHLGKVVSL